MRQWPLLLFVFQIHHLTSTLILSQGLLLFSSPAIITFNFPCAPTSEKFAFVHGLPPCAHYPSQVAHQASLYKISWDKKSMRFLL
jgi:hypothetical protein